MNVHYKINIMYLQIDFNFHATFKVHENNQAIKNIF